MTVRPKRSISLPPELDAAIDAAASLEGTSVSGWLADAAALRLRLEAGREGVEAWEAEHGRLTPEERAEGRRRARTLLDAAGSLPT